MSSEEAAAKNVASNSDENIVIEDGGNIANEDSDIISSPTIPTNLGGPPGKT